MSKFKIGQLVKIRSTEVILENTKKCIGSVCIQEMLDNGTMNPFLKHCGKTFKIVEMEDSRNIILEGIGADCRWFEEDLFPFNRQLELEF